MISPRCVRIRRRSEDTPAQPCETSRWTVSSSTQLNKSAFVTSSGSLYTETSRRNESERRARARGCAAGAAVLPVRRVPAATCRRASCSCCGGRPCCLARRFRRRAALSCDGLVQLLRLPRQRILGSLAGSDEPGAEMLRLLLEPLLRGLGHGLFGLCQNLVTIVVLRHMEDGQREM